MTDRPLCWREVFVLRRGDLGERQSVAAGGQAPELRAAESVAAHLGAEGLRSDRAAALSARVSLTLHEDGAMREAASISGRIW